MEVGDVEREAAARRAAGDVGIEVVESDRDRLAVESGGQGVLTGGAAHVEWSLGTTGWFPTIWAFLGFPARAEARHTDAVDGLTWQARRAAAGDRDALASFVAQSQADVWRLCAHLVDRPSADDLTQEVYLRAIPALTSFRADASARTWLLSVARNTCMDELRRRTRGRAMVDRLRRRAEVTSTVVPDASGVVAIDQAVSSLDRDRRDAFVLTQLLGLSYAETAEVCGCEIGTVRSRVARARAELIDQLTDARVEHGEALGSPPG
jgi:RNA polymerase sigma-70 factor, ECF subfamily